MKNINTILFMCKMPKDYLGEAGRKVLGRATNHAGKYKLSHLLKHALTRNLRHTDFNYCKDY